MSVSINGDEWVGNHGVWMTFFALFFVLLCYCIQKRLPFPRRPAKCVSGQHLGQLAVSDSSNKQPPMITDDDLQKLLVFIEGKEDEDGVPWENVIDKKNRRISYSSKRRDPKDGGATQYLSTTVFENCSAELLRDFYLDNDYRLDWDSTVLDHTQLDMHLETGTEIGRTVKKFPLMMAREYVLAWRIWEGQDQSFYCVTKSCEHYRAPRLQSCKRVESYFSGWRIQKVPGRCASEITMFHQEESGIQRAFAKLAFTRGIWNYVNKMELNLRRYVAGDKRLEVGLNAVAFAHQFTDKVAPSIQNDDTTGAHKQISGPAKSKMAKRRVEFLEKSLLVLGGAMFLTSSSTPLAAKIAAAFVVRRIVKSRSSKRSSCSSGCSKGFTFK